MTVTEVVTNQDRAYTRDEMMKIAAARELADGTVCFVGIGIPSVAANLARITHAPGVVLIYESGCIGAKPDKPPPSIGDGVLSATSDAVVSVPEIFTYWLQAGRIDIGFLGAAQLDRYGNINTTVIGDYASPRVRLPGAGGAPEIAASCKETIVILHHQRRALVERLDFVTSVGFGRGAGDREHLGLPGRGPRAVITDLGTLRPDATTCELTLVSTSPGVTVEEVRDATSWDLRVASDLVETRPPTASELEALRGLESA